MGGFGFAIFNVKDLDGRHWTFAQQQRNMSCGPTAVKTVKELYHNQRISEEAIRGAVGLQYLDEANKGMSLAQAALETDFRWNQLGSLPDLVLPAVQRQPLAIPGAHFAHGIRNLRFASRNHPAILGFWWENGGGHFVVCVGPTKTDPTLFVILDSWGGLQYLCAEEAIGTTFYYQPTYREDRGTIAPIGFIAT